MPTARDNHSWTLGPGDLPPAGEADLDEMRELADNAVYRRLIRQGRSRRRARMRMHALTLAGWLLVPWIYVQLLFPLTPGHAALASLPVSLAVVTLIGLLFLIGGIEGYESLRGILGAPVDVALSRITGRDLAAAIHARTFVFHSPALLGTAAGITLAAQFGLMHGIQHAGLPLLLQWVALGGIILASAVLALLRGLDSITLPGTLLWTRGIRRRYVARIAAREAEYGGDTELPLKGRARRLREVGMELTLLLIVAAVLAPLGLYWLAGEWLAAVHPGRPSHAVMSAAALIFAAAGWFAGNARVRRTRLRRRRNLEELSRELGELFHLRARWVSEYADG